MLRHFRDVYFSDQRYVLLYIHYFFFQISVAAMYVFTGAYFLKLGMPLPLVLLFYGLESGLRGFFCPFGLTFLNRVGLIPAVFVACTLLILFFSGVSLSGENLYIGFFSLTFSAAAGGILYPFYDVMEALYVDHDHHRGRQIAFSQFSKSLGRFAGTLVVGFLLQHYAFQSVVVFVSLSLLCAMLPFLKLQHTTQYIRGIRPAEIFAFVAGREFRPFVKGFFGFQLVFIVNAVMVPIYIYGTLGRMDQLSYVIAAAIFIEQIFNIFAGHYIDRQGAALTLRRSWPFYSAVTLAYMTIAKTPISIFVTESCRRMLYNSFSNAFFSGMHIKARGAFPERIMLFGAGSEMTLCFGELLVLSLYALLCWFIGIKVFYVTCAGAVLGFAVVVSSFAGKKPVY